MSDNTSDRGPERPRVEPEIIPPGANPRPRQDHENVFMQFEGRDGVHRIFIARPGWPAIIAALLIVGLFAAVVFVVLAGLVVLWIPIVILGILAAIVPNVARTYWRRIRTFLPGGH